MKIDYNYIGSNITSDSYRPQIHVYSDDVRVGYKIKWRLCVILLDASSLQSMQETDPVEDKLL